MDTEHVINYNVIIDAVGALIVCVTLFAGHRRRRGATLEMKLLRLLMLCCVAIFLLDIPGLLLDGMTFPGARALLWFLDTAYWAAHAVYCWLWLLFADCWNSCSPEGLRRRALVYALPLTAELAVLLANPWTGWVFTLDGSNIYTVGSAYQLNMLPYYLYILAPIALTVYGCVKSGDPERRRRGISLIVYMFLPICGVILEYFAYGVSWVWPLIALSLLMVYLNVQQQVISDEQLAAAALETELVESRIAVMLSQIQPHFLYNALCVIQNLCHDKAPEAEEAVAEFSKFLRGNLDSLTASKPIPFERELNHTVNYLSLEKKRFKNRLNVEYHIESTDFRIPALTLQPIVENAVRYGVCQREEGGTVRISAGEDERSYIVTVRDDGVGFDVMQKKTDGRTHVGITNVRGRLKSMCGGELEIRSTADVGTVAVLTIPKRTDK